jgi:tRNA pseudouridine55 synthase
MIESLEVVDWQPPVATLDIVCGKGTYIRSLAHELGKALGCGAAMRDLVRLRVGPFTIQESVTMEQLESAFQTRTGERYLYPADHALLGYDALIVNREQERDLINGRPIIPERDQMISSASTTISRAYTADGWFLGMVKYDIESAQWRPAKVFLKQRCNQ